MELKDKKLLQKEYYKKWSATPRARELNRRRAERYRKKHPERIKAYSKKHWREQKEKISEYYKKYCRTASGRKSQREGQAKMRSLYPEKALARDLLKQKIRSGKILRLPCAYCGSNIKIHGHHEDYSRPYDVIWMCHRHHSNYHNKLIPLPAANKDAGSHAEH